MSVGRLRSGELLAGGGAVVLFVALFLDKVVLESLERRFFSWRGELKS